MKAFKEFSKKIKKFKLIIGGNVPLLEKMNDWILSYKMIDKIDLVGILKSHEIATYLRSYTTFLHPSNYETFSVVCAEAISCEAQVIASDVRGIPGV